jgi:hypothetical protein
MTRSARRALTLVQDVAWLLVVGLLLPLWMFLALIGLVVIVAKQLALWAGGNKAAPKSPYDPIRVAAPGTSRP